MSFAAEHRLLVPDQVRALLGISSRAASTRLSALVRAGLLRRLAVFDRPSCFQITRAGLRAIGSSLPPPRPDLHAHDHDVGLGWLWLAAKSGTFGNVTDVLSERSMRSVDGRRDELAAPLAVRLAGVGPGGRARLHYPDLLLVTASGHCLAVELELTSKSRTRREKILMAYAGDRRIDAVLYLVEKESRGREIAACATRLGISRMVHVQLIARSEETRGGGRALSRRPPTRSRGEVARGGPAALARGDQQAVWRRGQEPVRG